jgi:hypothetical protein
MLTFPLTQFLIDLRLGRVRGTDPVAIAKHYGVCPRHVAGYLEQEGG